MNKLKSYLMEPVSTPFAGIFLILLCLACACPRMDKTNGLKVSNTNSSKPDATPKPVNKNNSTSENSNTYSDENESAENDGESVPSPVSSNSFFTGSWKVTQANAYMPDYKPLIINGDGTYIWEEPVSKEKFEGNWREESGTVILEKAYKGADWRVKVFKPGNENTTTDQIWINGIGEAMGFYEYKGFRAE